MKIPKQEYTAEFKELAVRRVKGNRGPRGNREEIGDRFNFVMRFFINKN